MHAGNSVFHFVTVMLLAPLFGVPSGMYPLHHRIMHHVVSNFRPICLPVQLVYNTALHCSQVSPLCKAICGSVQGPCGLVNVRPLCRKAMGVGGISHQQSSTSAIASCTSSGGMLFYVLSSAAHQAK